GSTRGLYGANLTGGALKAGDRGDVEGLVYAPEYDAAFEGWSKLLGTLFVSSNEVEADRRIRKAAIRRTIAQYYMTPWVENLARLPCRELNLSAFFAASYNDLSAYRNAREQLETVTASQGA